MLIDKGSEAGTVPAESRETWRVGRVWIAFQGLAAIVALLALLTAAGLFLSPVEGDVPAGPTCPSPAQWLRGENTERCNDAVSAIWPGEIGSLVVCLVALLLFVASRRMRRKLLQEARDELAATEVLTYRQDAMPWGYWTALLFVGGFGLFVVAVVALGTARGTSPGVAGGIFWGWLVYVTVWSYGLKRAYELRIVEDKLEWRAPFRRRRVPLRSLRSVAVVRLPGVLGEREATLTTDRDERLVVTVPNRKHQLRFARFCDALQRRAPDLEGTEAGASSATRLTVLEGTPPLDSFRHLSSDPRAGAG